jgi:hypothetical protein
MEISAWSDTLGRLSPYFNRKTRDAGKKKELLV